MNKYVEDNLKKIIEDPTTSVAERIRALEVMNRMLKEEKDNFSKKNPYEFPGIRFGGLMEHGCGGKLDVGRLEELKLDF